MHILNSFGPNPRTLRIYLLEKGLEIPMTDIDIIGGENREADYLAKNPGGAMPTLALDDGTYLAETMAICEYLEECHPQPPLLGTTAEERATTRMWIRRTELNIGEHMYHAFRYSDGYALFEKRVYCIPHAADDLKRKAQGGLAWLDKLIAGRDYIAGDHFSLADIPLFTVLDFMKDAGQPLDRGLANIAAWFDRVGARPAVQASVHPQAAELGWMG